MGHESKIEWTEATWNPWHGCHKVSQGCKNCYMFRDKARYGQDPNVVVRSKTTFYNPLKWTEPRRIFTCSWSDFFIEESDPWRDEAFAIMALTPQHTYQVLTKRPERMRDYLTSDDAIRQIAVHAVRLRNERKITFPNAEFHTEPLGYGDPGAEWFPLRNVHLGVSVEDQKTADERIPLLLETPATVRWLSMEPLLGPVDVGLWMPDSWSGGAREDAPYGNTPPIDWIVAGGESGSEARPTHPDWLRSIRDECTASNVPFFFKQWGEWYAGPSRAGDKGPMRICRGGQVETYEFDKHPDAFISFGLEGIVQRVGKKAAGRLLDGRTWDEMPNV